MVTDDLKNDLKMDVNWTMYGTGPEMIKAFKNGKLDIGYMGLPPAIIGIDNGVPIKCVAGGHVEGTIVIAKKHYKTMTQFKNNLKEVLAQFKGKSIGVPSKGSIHDVILNHYLEENNLLNDIEVKNYGQPEIIAHDMEKGLIEGGVGTPALAIFASTILNSHMIVNPENLWPYNPSYGIFAHRNLMENFPDLVEKFLIHHKEASKLIRETPLRAAEKISKIFKIMDNEYIKSILDISPKYCIALSDGYINSTMEFVNVLHELGYIKKNFNIDEIFNFEFVEKVHPEKEHYNI